MRNLLEEQLYKPTVSAGLFLGQPAMYERLFAGANLEESLKVTAEKFLDPLLNLSEPPRLEGHHRLLIHPGIPLYGLIRGGKISSLGFERATDIDGLVPEVSLNDPYVLYVKDPTYQSGENGHNNGGYQYTDATLRQFLTYLAIRKEKFNGGLPYFALGSPIQSEVGVLYPGLFTERFGNWLNGTEIQVFDFRDPQNYPHYNPILVYRPPQLGNE